MILIILSGVLLLASIAFIFISKYFNWDDYGVIGFIGTVSFGLSTVVCVTVAIAMNSNYKCCEERNWYKQQVIQLNSTYEVLINNSYNATAVQQYNSEVAEFKSQIASIQLNLNNPWVSWFNCKEYKNMSTKAVKYITR